MSAENVELKAPQWGVRPRGRKRLLALAIAGWCCVTSVAVADPIAVVPDPPARSQPTVVPPATFRPSWDLDGHYLWLGPVGAASHVEAKWDSTFGAEATFATVHEAAALGLVGATLGASRWTQRGGGRIWLDALVGTRVWGRMLGASLGPILELAEITPARIGASVGVWGYVGIAPFARIGAVSDLGMFAEVGVHIALPVLHR